MEKKPITRIKIITEDRYVLSATHFIPRKPVDRVIIINSATGVKQQFYASFAEYLTIFGFHVYTYDYRGIGSSIHGSVKVSNGSLITWGETDLSSVVDYVRQRHPGYSISMVGHSIGGQLIGLSERSVYADSFVLIASQTPYWKNFEGMMLFKVWMLWYVLIPVLTKLFGFFPAKTLRLFENLPAEAGLQWARWGKSNNFLFGEFPEKKKIFSGLDQPALVLSFSDDALAPYKAVMDLLQYYSNLKIQHKHISPDQIARNAIGHFNFFRKEFCHPLWAEVSDWLVHQHKTASMNKKEVKELILSNR